MKDKTLLLMTKMVSLGLKKKMDCGIALFACQDNQKQTEDKMSDSKKIKQAVKDFFNSENVKYVYATPYTKNHSANYYGDSRICKLNQGDVVSSIENAIDNWDWDKSDDAVQDAIDTILSDLQYTKPE
jgi:hypothetical protein